MTIKEAIHALVKPLIKPASISAVVTAVNDDATIDCTPVLGGAPILGAKLKPEGTAFNAAYMLLKPALNSTVTLNMLHDNDGEWIVSKIDQVESMEMVTTGGLKVEVNNNGDLIFNDGANGGIVIDAQLLTNLNSLKTLIQNVGMAIAPFTTSPSAATSAINTAISAHQFVEMKNPKIKH